MRFLRFLAIAAVSVLLAALVLGAMCQGPQGRNGVGVQSIVNNGDGTFMINMTDGSSYTTDNFAGPQGPQGTKGDKGDTGATGAQGPQGVQGATGQNGLPGAGVAWKSEWSSSTTYSKNDAVAYLGSSYISTQDSNTNHLPTDTAWWDVWVAKGDTGATGPQGPQGTKGDKGETGATGAQGPQGTKGDKGDTGAAGAGLPPVSSHMSGSIYFSNTSWANLPGQYPQCSVIIGPSGKALVTLCARLTVGDADTGSDGFMGFVVVRASDGIIVQNADYNDLWVEVCCNAGWWGTLSNAGVVTGLTPGERYLFQVVWKVNAGHIYIGERTIIVQTW